MILSMTGYGTGSAIKEDTAVTVEIRTVNHRFLDLHVRLAREYSFLEAEVQQNIRNLLGRGRVDVNIAIQASSPVTVLVNTEAARAYLEAAARLRDEFHLGGDLGLSALLSLPGVILSKDSDSSSADEAKGVLSQLVAESVGRAMDGVLQMRRREGDALRSDMLRQLSSIGEKARHIETLSPAIVSEYREKLQGRMAQLLSNGGIDPQRLAQEVALMADKCDISEEVTRLESHLRQYSDLVQTGAQVGKKLDFLLQEMQREVNTILSKAGNLEITNHAIAIKSDIEKLREQVQNVE